MSNANNCFDKFTQKKRKHKVFITNMDTECFFFVILSVFFNVCIYPKNIWNNF